MRGLKDGLEARKVAEREDRLDRELPKIIRVKVEAESSQRARTPCRISLKPATSIRSAMWRTSRALHDEMKSCPQAGRILQRSILRSVMLATRDASGGWQGSKSRKGPRELGLLPVVEGRADGNVDDARVANAREDEKQDDAVHHLVGGDVVLPNGPGAGGSKTVLSDFLHSLRVRVRWFVVPLIQRERFHPF